jgi:hypothetical protein
MTLQGDAYGRQFQFVRHARAGVDIVKTRPNPSPPHGGGSIGFLPVPRGKSVFKYASPRAYSFGFANCLATMAQRP